MSSNTIYNHFKYIDTFNTYSGSNVFNYVIPAVSVGKGRINNINPMEKVLWILRDLKSENLLQSDLSENEITDFANAIVEIDNTRMFDYRKKNKFALNLLLDKIKNHINENDLTKALNVIQDNYYFALNENRNRGEQIFFQAGINNNYQQDKNKNVQEYININNNFTPQVSLNYSKYKPLSLKKQIEYGANTTVGKNFWNNKTTSKIDDTTTIETKLKDDYTQINVQAYFQYGYYFSTRTNMQTGLSILYENRATKMKYIFAVPYFEYNYMINYRLRIRGLVQANVYNHEPTSERISRLNAIINLYYNLR